MKISLLTVTLLVWILYVQGSDGQPPPSCPTGWRAFGAKCYRAYNSLLQFDDAVQWCRSVGADLLSLHSDQERQFIFDYLLQQNVTGAYLGYNGSFSTTIGSADDSSNELPEELRFFANVSDTFSSNGTDGMTGAMALRKWYQYYANLKMKVASVWTDGSPMTYYKPDAVPGFPPLDGFNRQIETQYRVNGSEVAGDWMAFLVTKTLLSREGYESDLPYLWLNYVPVTVPPNIAFNYEIIVMPMLPTVCSGPVDQVLAASRRQNYQECPSNWNGSLCGNITCGSYGQAHNMGSLNSGCECFRPASGRYCQRVPALPPFDPAINATTQIRLVNISEDANNSRIGVAEVLLGGNWTTIYYDAYQEYDKTQTLAKMLCRMLGFPPETKAETFFYWRLLGDRQAGANFSGTTRNMLCSGREVDLSQCEFSETYFSPYHQVYVTGVECGVRTSMRLVDERGTETTEFGSGYLEILNRGVWSKVCSNPGDNEFGAAQASYACERLGFLRSNVTYSPPRHDCDNFGTDFYYARNNFGATVLLQCPQAGQVYGTNSECQAIASRSCYSCTVQLDCLGIETAFTKATTERSRYTTPEWHQWTTRAPVVVDESRVAFRLVLLNGSTTAGYGRVEVQANGEWGTVCDDTWGQHTTVVLCRSLGYYGSSVSSYERAHFGEGSGRIWLDDVMCSGTERSLTECYHGGWGRHNCGHNEDVSVDCTGEYNPYGPYPTADYTRNTSAVNATYRLVAPNGFINIGYGRVEVNHNGSWGTVCDDLWDTEEAYVLCRSIGYSRAIPHAYGNAAYGSGNGSIHLDDLNCFGGENSLTECQHRGWGRHDCSHREDAGVDCTGYNPPNGSNNNSFYRTTTQASIDGANVTVRLVTPSGATNQTYGRVEVRVNGVWGTVCDDNWGPNEAKVVCASIGFDMTGEYRAVGHQRAHYGPGSGPVWMDDVYCTGTETSFDQCRHNGLGQHNCVHNEDAAVNCAVRSLPARFRHDSAVGLPPGVHYGKLNVAVNMGNQTVDREACIRGMSPQLIASMICRSLGLPEFMTALRSAPPHYVRYEERRRYALIDDCGTQASVTLDQCRVSLGEDETMSGSMNCGDDMVLACLGPPPGFDGGENDNGDSTVDYMTGGGRHDVTRGRQHAVTAAGPSNGEGLPGQPHGHFFRTPELESDNELGAVADFEPQRRFCAKSCVNGLMGPLSSECDVGQLCLAGWCLPQAGGV